MSKSPKICINLSHHFGDICQLLFLAPLLKKHFPDCQVGWVVWETYVPLVKYASAVDELIVLKDHEYTVERRVSRSPAISEYYDYVLTPNCSSFRRARFVKRYFKDAIHIGITPNLTKKYAWKRWDVLLLRFFYDRTYKRDFYLDPYRVEPIRALNQTFKCAMDWSELVGKLPVLSLPETTKEEMRGYLSADKPNIVLVPCSSSLSKDFPEEGYMKLLRETGAEYHYIITYGSEREETVARRLAERTGTVLLQRRYSIPHLAALMEMADMVLGGDTGPVHLAWLQNTKSVVLFGRKWGPIKLRDALHRISIYDGLVFPVVAYFPNLFGLLPSIVRSWVPLRRKTGG